MCVLLKITAFRIPQSACDCNGTGHISIISVFFSDSHCVSMGFLLRSFPIHFIVAIIIVHRGNKNKGNRQRNKKTQTKPPRRYVYKDKGLCIALHSIKMSVNCKQRRDHLARWSLKSFYCFVIERTRFSVSVAVRLQIARLPHTPYASTQCEAVWWSSSLRNQLMQIFAHREATKNWMKFLFCLCLLCLNKQRE